MVLHDDYDAHGEPDVTALVRILLDKSARVDERDDAAMYLAKSNDEAAAAALLQVGSDASENELIAASCGESLAQIAIRRERADKTWLSGLAPVALNEFVAWISRERPELLPA